MVSCGKRFEMLEVKWRFSKGELLTPTTEKGQHLDLGHETRE